MANDCYLFATDLVLAIMVFYLFSAFIHAVDKGNTTRSSKPIISSAERILRFCSAMEGQPWVISHAHAHAHAHLVE